jgi:hypothetical protein
MYVGLHDYHTGVRREGEGGFLSLQVQFQGSTQLVDVSTDPNVVFFTTPSLPDPPAILPAPKLSGIDARLKTFVPQIDDAGRTITLSGRYTDPQSQVSVTDSLQIQLRILEAPLSFDPNGVGQSLIDAFRSFARKARTTLGPVLGQRAAYRGALAEIATVEQGLQQWWPEKVAHVEGIGSTIYDELSDAARVPLLRELSDLIDRFARAGLLDVRPEAQGAWVFPASLAPWGEYEAFILNESFQVKGPLLWYGIGRR